jgi:hypothetical protein
VSLWFKFTLKEPGITGETINFFGFPSSLFFFTVFPQSIDSFFDALMSVIAAPEIMSLTPDSQIFFVLL